jgi:uncharacterized BrkB/YihY/UPF0761 family membrane protein
MNLDNYLQEAGALATLAGILAGFGISAVVQLLGSERKDKIITAAVIVFAASTVMFLYSLIVSVLTFAAAAELNAVPTQLDGINISGLLVIFAAVYVFLAGIAIAGWVRSKIAGIFTTIFALISACLIGYVIVSVIAVFA